MTTRDLSAVIWRKASRSAHEGGACVEVGSIPQMPVEAWRKASQSGHQGGDCVEVAGVPQVPAEVWRKASRSDHHGGDCVEVAKAARVVAVRDSKDPDGPKLAFAAAEWRAFARRVAAGAHDLTHS